MDTMPGVQYSLYTISAIYLFLSFMVVWLMVKQVKSVQEKYGNLKLE